MKTLLLIFIVIVFSVAAATETGAKSETKVLCRMLESSLSNPWEFDTVVNTERNNFDNVMVHFIQDQVNKLTTQSKQREAYCKPHKNKSMAYDLCMGNNPASKLAVWLKSVSQAVNGSQWRKTEFGKGQLRIWDSCNNPALCEQLRLAAAIESRQVCPTWLANK